MLHRITADSVLGLDLDQHEDAFLDAVYQVLKQGNYMLMSEAELQAALTANYNLMVNVEVCLQPYGQLAHVEWICRVSF